MKHKLLLAFALLFTLEMNSQTIMNGGFEYWNSSTMDLLNFYPFTSNPTTHQLGLPFNALKVSDPQQGALAIQLTTVANATDTMFGYFANGDPGNYQGGIPYNQHPVSLTGYYKSNIMPGDSGILLVIFKEAGVVLSMDAAFFTGAHSTYTPFTITLTIPPLANPDSIIVVGVSSNAFVNNGIAGSMLQLDNLTFTGVPSQPAMMNGSFEAWSGVNASAPLNWSTAGDVVTQSTDAHSGNFALQLTTTQYDPSNFGPSYATNGNLGSSGAAGGRPYSLSDDTLCGWYKFIPNGIDSATIGLQTSQMTTAVGGAFQILPPASTYTFFSIPFSSFSAPDTLLIMLSSSSNDVNPNNVGSVLKVDDLYLKSSLVGIAPTFSLNTFGFVQLYPNPSSTDAWMEWNNTNENPTLLTITDELGRIVSTSEFSGTGHHREHIDTSVLAKGSYVITLTQGENHTSRKLFVQ